MLHIPELHPPPVDPPTGTGAGRSAAAPNSNNIPRGLTRAQLAPHTSPKPPLLPGRVPAVATSRPRNATTATTAKSAAFARQRRQRRTVTAATMGRPADPFA
ncbi:uncharacterized protein P884DRAFT_259695 [Thermothelomyces heterothallicus CBS 202.75]|uniref:uncharacterized protein n=1 Tax=Thermothelomyces heterothallicus CBS 202.75 TaxID=1149848 RepID=UPI003744858D